MNFTDIFIRRPVLAIVLSLVILLVGIRSYFSLQIRLFPKISASVVNVRTSYAGADAALMESFITTPIENSLGGIDGIDYITSSSSTSSSDVTVHFKLGYDINAAVSDVNSKVSSARYLLPKDINDPIVSKSDPSAQPSMWISFAGDNIAVEDITDYLKRVIQPQIQTLSGVGNAMVWGPENAMRIWLDPMHMAALGITPADVSRALSQQSLQAPGGQLKTGLQEFSIRTFSEASTAAQFNDLILRQNDGQMTRIRDIGHAELGPKYTDISVQVNGKPGVVLAVIPSSISNPLEISAEIKKIFPSLITALPKNIHAHIMGDAADYIAESIKEVKKTVVESTLCVIFVVFLFLGSWRTLLIPTVTIPLSLIGVFAVMYFMGYSLNIITFLSMVLAIGMVVDDAIVVSENIHRHIAHGKSAYDAALLGAREIQFAVIAMTLTLAAVYAPIGFLTGLIGSIFKEFAFTLSGAVVISGFVALTLSPMMCSKVMLPHGSEETKFTKKINSIFDHILQKYEMWLHRVLANRKKVLFVIPIVLLLTGVIYFFVPSELVPTEDEGYIFAPIMAPTSANVEYTKKYSQVVENIFSKVPEGDNYLVVNGQGMRGLSANSGIALLILKPWAERKRSTDEIISSLFPQLWSIPGIIAFPINPSGLPGVDSGTPIQLELQTIGDYKKLNEVAQQIFMATQKNWHLYNVRVEPKLDQPQLGININREKAGDVGVPISDIGYAINIALGQPTSGHFSKEGRGYDVMLELYPEYSNQPDTLNNIYLRTASGSMIPLRNLVDISEEVTPQSYDHFQQMRSIEITANTIPGYTLGQALSYFQNIVKSVAPDNVKIDYAGMSRLYFQTGGQMMVTFIFAIIFIFLVLAAQFESFRDPLIVLFTIPLSMFGAFLAMLATRGTMNIYSEIGLVTLVGLISKHGILMVEFANKLQAEGKEIKDAIISAATVRLRPILMTTGAMILGTLPLALAHGAGAVSRRQIGWVVIGGMLIGTIFTLFIVPTMYTYIATKKKAKK